MPWPDRARRASTNMRTARAQQHAVSLAPVLAEFQRAGIRSCNGLAQALNERGITTSQGFRWGYQSVARLLRRLDGAPLNPNTWDPPEPELSPLQQAIDAHVDRFGEPPAVWGIYGLGRNEELAEAIRAAIRSGKPFDPASMGVTDPPPGADT